MLLLSIFTSYRFVELISVVFAVIVVIVEAKITLNTHNNDNNTYYF